MEGYCVRMANGRLRYLVVAVSGVKEGPLGEGPIQ